MNIITAICFLLFLACTTTDTSKVPESLNVAVDPNNNAIPIDLLHESFLLPIVEAREVHRVTTRAVETNSTLSSQALAAQARLQSIYSVAGFQIGQLAQYLQGPTAKSFSNLDIVGMLTNPESLMNLFANISQLTTTFMSLIIVVGIFLIIGILMLFVAIVFGFCRLCNRCGGKYPKKTGYSVKQIAIVSLLIVAFSIIVWFFAAMVFVHSSEVTRSVASIRVGLSNVFAEVRSMIQNTNTVVSGAGDQINVGTQKILTDLHAYNVSSPVAVLLTPAFNQVYDSLMTLATTISSSKDAATASDSLLDGIKTDLDSTRNQLTSIKSDVDALASVTVNGVTIPVTLPDTSALDPTKVPDSSTVQDISGYISKLNSAPDLTQVATDSKTTYDTFTGDLPGKYNDTLVEVEKKIGSPGSTVDSMAANLQKQLLDVDSIVASIDTNVNNIYESGVTRADAIRNDATKGVMIVLIIPFALAFIGVVVQKRKCVSFLAPICAIFVFLASVQFILYYVISIPLNGYCTSKGNILNTLYPLQGSATIQPQYVLVNCIDGQSLLTMQLSSDNSTLADVVGVGALLGGDYSAFIGNFSDSVTFPTTTLPSSTTQMDQLNSLDLASLDFSSYNVNFTPINITSAKSTLQDFGASLTPHTFKPSWTQSAFDQNLADFNALVQQAVPGFATFTYDSIKQDYLPPNTTFKASAVTSDPTAQNQIQSFYDNNVYQDALFKFGADPEILRLQGAINAIGVKLDTLESSGLAPLTDKVTSLSTNIGNLETLIKSIDGTSTTLISATNQFAGVVGQTVNTIKDEVINLIEEGVKSVFGGLVGNFEDVGRCSTLAYDLEYAQETVCTNTVMSVNVLWFSFSVICISCLISFILGVKGQKRIGCRRQIAPSEETALKKKKALEEF